VASAGTVILSLLALTLAELNSTKAGTRAGDRRRVAMLSMMTLLPALLVITGRWVFWPPSPGTAQPSRRPGLLARIGRRIAVRPRVVWITTALILGSWPWD